MTKFKFEVIKDQLIKHEGIREFPYRDSKGFWTIGIGHCIDERITGDKTSQDFFVLENTPANQAQIDNFFNRDLTRIVMQLDHNFPWWNNLDEIRQRILVDMTFNLGIGHIILFKNFLRNLEFNNYMFAAAEMIDSDWYRDLWKLKSLRALRLIKWMMTGDDKW